MKTWRQEGDSTGNETPEALPVVAILTVKDPESMRENSLCFKNARCTSFKRRQQGQDPRRFLDLDAKIYQQQLCITVPFTVPGGHK
jgi:hypothetical protein